jgi:hypothetical protein
MGHSPAANPTAFVLTPDERSLPFWTLRLKPYLEQRLQCLRERNDAEMPEDKRGVLIGRIKELKHLLESDTSTHFAASEASDTAA